MYYKTYAQILENKVISDHPMATIQPVLSFQLIFLSGFFFQMDLILIVDYILWSESVVLKFTC
jgi:hypothetical protein